MPRLTVSFDKVAADRLGQISQGRSIPDVIREALSLEEIFQRAISDGAKLIIRGSNGEADREIVRA